MFGPRSTILLVLLPRITRVVIRSREGFFIRVQGCPRQLLDGGRSIRSIMGSGVEVVGLSMVSY